MKAVAAASGIGTRVTRQELHRKARRRRVIARLAVVLLGLTASVLIMAMAAMGNKAEKPVVTETAPVIQTSYITAEHVAPETVPMEETPVVAEPEMPFTEEEVRAMAQTVYGESMITGSDMEMAAVAWCILNRVDSDDPFYPEGIMAVITQNRQFHGYSEQHPVDEHIEWLVRDVLGRWIAEKSGAVDVGRVLPKEYLFFYGDGRHNYFTVEYQSGVKWDWSLPNPYEN